MSAKITTRRVKNYKPEVLICPFCGAKLVYRHTVSNKIIQFSSGSYIRVKNLGYACSNEICEHREFIYSSQTASKLCVKGYTYSAKVLAMIYYYKSRHHSREKICDLLSEKGIQISDRNIDLIHDKYVELLAMNYEAKIINSYQKMIQVFKEIRIAIDFLRVENMSMISIRDGFCNEQIGIHFIEEENSVKISEILSKYIVGYDIAYIITIRKNTDSYHFINELVSFKTRIIHFLKD